MIKIATQAQKEAKKRYKAKTKQKVIEYYPKEIEEWNATEKYLNDEKISYQQYAKELIKKDLKKKGYIK